LGGRNGIFGAVSPNPFRLIPLTEITGRRGGPELKKKKTGWGLDEGYFVKKD